MLGTSAEWSALLECASSQFDPNRFKALLQGARWAKLLRLAEGHGVVNLLALRLPEAAGVTLPDEVHSKLLESQRQ